MVPTQKPSQLDLVTMQILSIKRFPLASRPQTTAKCNPGHAPPSYNLTQFIANSGKYKNRSVFPGVGTRVAFDAARFDVRGSIPAGRRPAKKGTMIGTRGALKTFKGGHVDLTLVINETRNWRFFITRSHGVDDSLSIWHIRAWLVKAVRDMKQM